MTGTTKTSSGVTPLHISKSIFKPDCDLTFDTCTAKAWSSTRYELKGGFVSFWLLYSCDFTPQAFNVLYLIISNPFFYSAWKCIDSNFGCAGSSSVLRITFYCFFNQPHGEILIPVLFLAETLTVLSRSGRASLPRFGTFIISMWEIYTRRLSARIQNDTCSIEDIFSPSRCCLMFGVCTRDACQ